MLKLSEFIYLNKKNLLLLPFLLIIYSSFGQVINTTPLDSIQPIEIKKKTNPIIYGDVILGFLGGDLSGIFLGLELNTQWKRSLFSIRSINSGSYGITFPNTGLVFIPIPNHLYTDHESNETAILYGWRFIQKWTAINISIGISENRFDQYALLRGDSNNISNPRISRIHYLGIPYEINFNMFRGYKRRMKLFYGFFPVGRPTGFGEGLGFKFFGNISKKPFIGGTISAGFGYYKHY